MPYEASGLTREQAAAHLLSRFTFGARPGEVGRVAQEGLERWFDAQLEGQEDDAALDGRLAAFPAVGMTVEEMARTFPPRGRVLAEGRVEPNQLRAALDGIGDSEPAAADDSVTEPDPRRDRG